MNVKLFFRLIFYIIGTFIVLFFGIIVVSNFVKDARIFAKPIVTAQAQAVQKIPEVAQDSTDDEVKTLKYKRAADAMGSEEDFGEEGPKTKTSPNNSSGSAIKIKVEIVNYTGLKSIAEELKTTLEAAGFEAGVVNYKANKSKRTSIIERNSKKLGVEVQKVLNIGQVVKAIDPKSKVDVTLIVGEDYKP